VAALAAGANELAPRVLDRLAELDARATEQ